MKQEITWKKAEISVRLITANLEDIGQRINPDTPGCADIQKMSDCWTKLIIKVATLQELKRGSPGNKFNDEWKNVADLAMELASHTLDAAESNKEDEKLMGHLSTFGQNCNTFHKELRELSKGLFQILS